MKRKTDRKLKNLTKDEINKIVSLLEKRRNKTIEKNDFQMEEIAETYNERFKVLEKTFNISIHAIPRLILLSLYNH